MDTLLNIILPPPPVVEKKAASAADAPPVAYSAAGNFLPGQRLIHKKFGDLVVTNAGDTFIEVDLPDGSKKCLAQNLKD